MRRAPPLFMAIIFLSATLFSSCVTSNIPKEALSLPLENLQNRQLQTRRYDTDETTLISAAAGVLQDFGFMIDESETDLGVIACSKTRDAINGGQIVILIFSILFGSPPRIDEEQLIRASAVTRPLIIDSIDKSKSQTAIRVTFQRIVTNTQGQVTKQECINEPDIYTEFFDKLSQSLFLEAHEI